MNLYWFPEKALVGTRTLQTGLLCARAQRIGRARLCGFVFHLQQHVVNCVPYWMLGTLVFSLVFNHDFCVPSSITTQLRVIYKLALSIKIQLSLSVRPHMWLFVFLTQCFISRDCLAEKKQTSTFLSWDGIYPSDNKEIDASQKGAALHGVPILGELHCLLLVPEPREAEVLKS